MNVSSDDVARDGDRPPSATPSVPVFDRVSFGQRTMGDSFVARVVLQGFLQDLPERIQALDESFSCEDIQGATREAHSIKGAAATVCAESLRRLAAEMEAFGRVGDFAGMRLRMPTLRERCALTRAELLRFQATAG